MWTSARKFSLSLVQRGLWTFFQRLAIPDPAFARIAGEFEILRQFESVGGTRIFAQPAEHAAAQVVGKVGEFFAASFFVAFAGDDNQMLGTCQSAQVARNAHRLVSIGIHVQPWRTAVALGHLRPLQRILLGIDLLGVLIAEGNLQSLDQVHEKDFAQQAWHAHNAVSIPLKPASLKGIRRIPWSRVAGPRLPPETNLRSSGSSGRGRAALIQGTFSTLHPYLATVSIMKAYFSNLPTKIWLLLVLPAIVVAYPVAKIVVPAVIHAVVPEVVRSVLSVI
jgi:hypothetical protein